MLKCMYVFNDRHVLIDGSTCIDIVMGNVEREGRIFETFARFGDVMLFRESVSRSDEPPIPGTWVVTATPSTPPTQKGTKTWDF
jgi:hypothetical protein